MAVVLQKEFYNVVKISPLCYYVRNNCFEVERLSAEWTGEKQFYILIFDMIV